MSSAAFIRSPFSGAQLRSVRDYTASVNLWDGIICPGKLRRSVGGGRHRHRLAKLQRASYEHPDVPLHQPIGFRAELASPLTTIESPQPVLVDIAFESNLSAGTT